MLKIYLKQIKCNQETNEVGADEPFVLVTAVDLASSAIAPAFDVVKYGPFADVDKGETHRAPGINQSFWGLNNSPASLSDPDNAIFVVSLMENDDGQPDTLRTMVKAAVATSVLSSLSFSRRDKVVKLIRDINGALRTPTGFPNIDDKVGSPIELRFNAAELAQAEAGRTVQKTMLFVGDGGRYTLTFEAAKSN